jgi:hypothetical protein
MAETAPKKALGFGLLIIKKKSLRLVLSSQISKSPLFLYLTSRPLFNVTNGKEICWISFKKKIEGHDFGPFNLLQDGQDVKKNGKKKGY